MAAVMIAYLCTLLIAIAVIVGLACIFYRNYKRDSRHSMQIKRVLSMQSQRIDRALRTQQQAFGVIPVPQVAMSAPVASSGLSERSIDYDTYDSAHRLI